MKRIPIILVVITAMLPFRGRLLAQSVDIEPPLNIPLLLSGNFGELRGTHFHAGIDLKTQGVTGKPVFSAMDGYVSRFKVQAGGYGHAVYISHPNGYTSVYAHLEEFYPELEAYLKKYQYNKRSFEVDVYPEKGKFTVKKGQQIGISGNTGRSGGPHLHFEVRNSSQVPQNVLKYKLPIEDTIPPKFIRLAVYNQIDSKTFQWSEKKFFNTTRSGNVYRINKTLEVDSNVAFGVEVYDFLNGTQNKCGVYRLGLFIDSQLIYSFKIDEISFSESKYIKSHLDFEEKKKNKKNVHQLFCEPNNKLRIYDELIMSGLIGVTDTLLHNASVVAHDVHGNSSVLEFTFRNKNDALKEINDSGDLYVDYERGKDYRNDVFQFLMHPNSLFSDSRFSYSTVPGDSSHFSDIHIIGNEYIPFKKQPTLTMKVTRELGEVNPEKLVIVSLSENGGFKSEGGEFIFDGVRSNVSGFGRFVLVADTVAPDIKPYSFKNKGWYAANDKISFKITDELSGINTYNGYIDDYWVLFEYDAKSGNLTYKIDASRLSRKKESHKLKLFVLDNKNNMQKFEGEFYF